MPDVLISENIVGEAMDALRASCDAVFAPELWRTPDQLLALIPDFKALIARNQTLITREVLTAGAQLQVVGRAGVGMDNVDQAAADELGIVIAWTPEQNTNSVAELTIGLMLALARMIPEANRDTKAGGWHRQRFMGCEISGKTLGIIGYGRIGSCTALKARALGMEIFAYDPYIDPASLRALEARAHLKSFAEVLAQADFLSLHLPENEETRGMFGAAEFGQMKRGAFFLNAARGGIVQEAALLEALQEGHLAGAALEVRQQEPGVPSAFDLLPSVIQVPHIGAQTHEAQHRVVTAICRDVLAVLRGEAAQNFVNFARPHR